MESAHSPVVPHIEGPRCKTAAFLPFPGLLPHQDFAKDVFAAHDRALINHPVGSGKTLTMIQILSRFAEDERPKIVLFPNDSVRKNFFMELLKWPSKYRSYQWGSPGTWNSAFRVPRCFWPHGVWPCFLHSGAAGVWLVFPEGHGIPRSVFRVDAEWFRVPPRLLDDGRKRGHCPYGDR